jgi:hypothetical protein
MGAVEAHMDYVTEHSHDQIGERTTPMWISTIDLRTNGLPTPLIPNSPRWNGTLLSAAGANLYWDQPSILAAFELSKRTGCKCYSDSASAYIRSFLNECANSNRQSSLDPRCYYDIKLEKLIDTTATISPCTPYTPAWETLWVANTAQARQQIQAYIHAQKAAVSTSDSNDTPIGDTSHAGFATLEQGIESEAALIASLCWLAQKDPPQKQHLVEQALSLAKNRMKRRNHKTGLVPTNIKTSHEGCDTSSLQLGAWAYVLFQATELTGEPQFQSIAKKVLNAWISQGFNEQQQRYDNRLDCTTGQPTKNKATQITETEVTSNNPPQTSIFNHVNRPAYQSPLRMAEACLSLHEATGDQPSKLAVERWVNMIKQELPANDGRGAYAEDYGRAIHFLVRASNVMKNPTHHTLARDIANEAMEQLYVPKMGMFRSHPGENRCDSVDGPGFLLLALMYMEGSDPTQHSALQF